MKNLITIFLIILITTLVLTSVIKLIKNLNYNNEKTYQVGERKNIETNQSIPKWIKHDYLLPNGSWVLQNLSSPLVFGKKYFLVQKILNEEKCFFGMVFLKKIQGNNLYFKIDKSYFISRLRQYSRIKSKKIITVVFSEEDFPVLGKIQNCNEWVKIENN